MQLIQINHFGCVKGWQFLKSEDYETHRQSVDVILYQEWQSISGKMGELKKYFPTEEYWIFEFDIFNVNVLVYYCN